MEDERMERYDNIVKSAEIRKLVEKKMYQKALQILNTMEVEKIKMLSDLSIFAEVYMKTGQYDQAKEVLLRIRKKSNRRKVLYQLIKLSIKTNNVVEAETYYEEYIQMAPKDAERYILRYRIDKKKGESNEKLIETLETLKNYDYSERWAYELAKRYHKAGRKEECIRECKDILLWFGEGVLVEKARMLKEYYEGGADWLRSGKKTAKQEAPIKLLDSPEVQEALGMFGAVPWAAKQCESFLQNKEEAQPLSCIILAGEQGSGKTTLAKGLVRAIKSTGAYEGYRMAKIQGEKLNGLSLEERYDKLQKNFLLIEHAEQLEQRTIGAISAMYEAVEGNIVVLFEVTPNEAKQLNEQLLEISLPPSKTIWMQKNAKDDRKKMAVFYLKERELDVAEEAESALEEFCQDERQFAVFIEELERVCKRAEKRLLTEIRETKGLSTLDLNQINQIRSIDFEKEETGSKIM